MSNDKFKKIRSFVRREGRLTSGQQRALDELWPRCGLDTDQLVANWSEVFKRSAPVCLEIGFGDGANLLHLAKLFPERDFVGIEVHRPGIGHLLRQMEAEGLENIRVYNGDAVEIFQHCFMDNSLDLIMIYFPDPWHKKRHHKRRLIQKDFAQLLLAKLKPHGELHLATDWEHYAEHMLTELSEVAGLENLAGPGQFAQRAELRPVTKFERRGQRLGHGVWDLQFRKRQK